jgi:hypothetical protein
LQLLSQTEPCSLYGEVHTLVIHSCVARSYRNPKSMEDVWIDIPVRCCRRAKALGLQCTKRLEEAAKAMALTPLERLEKLLDRQMKGQLRAGAGRCRPVPIPPGEESSSPG